ncbi:unnamed protein product [Pleuronectes platessa]|uniref:Uncharacterized protein n=1 Tax=Pleuronectes platessa TaxID=8262 RepID=A0A9N7YP96_PLEPL|nr:unnamed protein product [Pleuronectes platessa]
MITGRVSASGGRVSPPAHVTRLKSALSQVRHMNLSPHPKVINLRSSSSPGFDLNVPHLAGFPLHTGSGASVRNWTGRRGAAATPGRSVGALSDGGSCGAGRQLFSWDVAAAVKRLIWRQREERTYLQ